MKALQDWIQDLERALGRKTLEAGVPKKSLRDPQAIDAATLRAPWWLSSSPGGYPRFLAAILVVPRHRLYSHAREPRPTVRPQGNDDRAKAAMRERVVIEPRRRHFGYRRWKAVLGRKRGLVVNHKRVRRLLHEPGWVQPRFRGRWPIRAPRPTAPTGPNQVWLIDMTKVTVG